MEPVIMYRTGDDDEIITGAERPRRASEIPTVPVRRQTPSETRMVALSSYTDMLQRLQARAARLKDLGIAVPVQTEEPESVE